MIVPWIRKTLSAEVVLLLLCAALLGDHLPETKLARGNSEMVLAGIDISSFLVPDEHGMHHDDFRTRVPDVVAKFGRFSRREIRGDTPGKETGECEYVWAKPHVQLATTIFCSEDGSTDLTGIHHVVVSGTSREAKWKTGAGVGLGDSISDIRRAYGSRYVVYHTLPEKTRELMLQWPDGTELSFRFDSSGRINYVSLRVAIE